LPEFSERKELRGIGLTDPEPIAALLAERFTYRNTFLTTEPRLDIRRDPSPLGELDFLIASEVFEHIEPPVAPAFENAARTLKPAGALLFTVPWVWDGDAATAIPELHDWRLACEDGRYHIVDRRAEGAVECFRDMAFDGGPGPSLGRTREHFPRLRDWRIVETGGETRLVNTLADGSVESYANLAFHGGPGLALEMRLFTRRGIEEHLRAAGFDEIEFESRDHPEYGIFFHYPWSRPVMARKSARGRASRREA
jgi:SAM-dependent methyltransferase